MERGLNTRRALEQAAVRLFVRNGFQQTSVGDIARAAMVSPRTFFRHFVTKEDVLLGDHAEMRHRLAECFAARPRDEPVLSLVREALVAFATAYEDQRDEYLLRAQIGLREPSVMARRSEQRGPWEALITSACAERLGVDPRLDVRPALITRATLAALEIAMEQWVEGDGSVPLPRLFEEIVGLLQDNFGVEREHQTGR